MLPLTTNHGLEVPWHRSEISRGEGKAAFPARQDQGAQYTTIWVGYGTLRVSIC